MIRWLYRIFFPQTGPYDFTTTGDGGPLPVLLKQLEDDGVLRHEIR